MSASRPSTPLLLALFLWTPIAATETSPPVEFGEDPQAAVASEEAAVYGRVRHLEGAATLRRDSRLLGEISVNEPVLPGDTFQIGEGGRLEAQTSDGSLLRLKGGTGLTVMNLPGSGDPGDETTLLQLLSGSLIVSSSSITDSGRRFQIDTDAASVFILTDGEFRIDLRPDGTVVVVSRRGAAEVVADEDSVMVRSGERLAVLPGRAPGEPQAFNTRLRDEFDVWSSDRDDALVRQARADEQAPPNLPAAVEPFAEELSYYGNWINSPSYGWVWRPTGLASDWRPYYYGRWAWSPAGAIWVSSEPWGWAPFHYGRWEFAVGSGWVWIPGYIYSGGWVAWSYAPGYFGWCALGFYDYPIHYRYAYGYGYGPYYPWVYVPSHHLYHRHVTKIVVRDARTIHHIESNRVVVRNGRRVSPSQVSASPDVATELHTRLRSRPEQTLRPEAGERRTPFREQERRRLVEANEKRLQREGRAVRQVASRPSYRPVSASQPRGPQVRQAPAARRQGPGARPDSPGTTPPQGNPPPARRNVEDRDREPAAGSSDAPPPPRSRPERVVPRIVPRRTPQEPERGAPPKDQPSARPEPRRSNGGESRARPQGRPPQPKQQHRPSQQGGGRGSGRRQD